MVWESELSLLEELQDVLERQWGIYRSGKHYWTWLINILELFHLRISSSSIDECDTIILEATKHNIIQSADDGELLNRVSAFNLIVVNIQAGFKSWTSTNSPVSWVGKLRNTSLGEFNTLDLVLNIIHSDFVHASGVGLSAINVESAVVTTSIGVVSFEVVRGLHLEHEVAIHMEWIMSDGEDVFSAQSLNGIAHFLWKDKSMIDPSDFDRNLLVIDWVRTTSVAETKFNRRDVVIQEVLTVSELQT